jgi:hypothetical protein
LPEKRTQILNHPTTFKTRGGKKKNLEEKQNKTKNLAKSEGIHSHRRVKKKKKTSHELR